MLMLGAIGRVNELDLTINLPNGMTGYCSMREGG
jgi:hypothetical protein